MQNGEQSKELSNGILSHILSLLKGVPIEQITYEELKKYANLIRKLAHFTVFFILGVFSCWSTWILLGKHYVSISFVFCVLYACFDEIHQFFSDGRGPALKDVIIDSIGALIGISLVAFIIFCITDKKNDSSFD